MPRKCVAIPTVDIVQVICKPEAKKTGDNSNACVCLYKSLKLSTDDQVTSKRSQLKTYYIVLYDSRFNLVEFLANYNSAHSSIQLTQKNTR